VISNIRLQVGRWITFTEPVKGVGGLFRMVWINVMCVAIADVLKSCIAQIDKRATSELGIPVAPPIPFSVSAVLPRGRSLVIQDRDPSMGHLERLGQQHGSLISHLLSMFGRT
jgi:hypothetical protein